MRFLKEMPIRIQLLILAVFSVMIVMLVIFISYFDTLKTFNINNNEYAYQFISQSQKAVSMSCGRIARIIYNVAYSSPVQGRLVSDDATKKIEYGKLEKSFLRNVRDMNDGVLDILVFDNDNEAGFYNMLGESEEYMEARYSDVNKQKVYFSERKQYKIGSINYSCFMAAVHVYFSGGELLNETDVPQGTKLGSVIVVFNSDMMSLIPEDASLQARINLLLLDRGQAVFSKSFNVDGKEEEGLLSLCNLNASDPQTIVYKDVRYIVQSGALPYIGGNIVSVINENELFAPINKARIKVFSILFAALVFLSIPFLLIINNIVKPLNKLIRFMSVIKSGNLKHLKKRVDLKGYAEIRVMAVEFNNMLDEIDSLTHRLLESNTRLYETELIKKQSEMAFLQSQINPHFLYNTLESIKGMSLVKGADEIWEMAQALGQILRYSIKGADMVPLNEECGIIRAYVHIQKIRFIDRFTVRYEFDEKVMDYTVPKMILQPFVENAIYYGLEPRSSCGVLYIGGKLNLAGDIEITVRDNGAGMEKDKLEELRQSLAGYDGKPHQSLTKEYGGIGIINVNNRLRLIYGRRYGIRISSGTGEGTEVVVTIPAKEDSDV